MDNRMFLQQLTGGLHQINGLLSLVEQLLPRQTLICLWLGCFRERTIRAGISCAFSGLRIWRKWRVWLNRSLGFILFGGRGLRELNFKLFGLLVKRAGGDIKQ